MRAKGVGLSVSGASAPPAPTSGALDAAAEAAIVERVRGGDGDAYGKLVHVYMRRAFAVAYRVLRHTEDAEDVVQDAFLAALERIDTFQLGRPFGPWLLRIVANLALNRRAANAVRAAAPLPDERFAGTGVYADVAGNAFAGNDDPQRDAEGSEVRDRFRAALSELAPRPRLVVELADLDGFTPTEIATLLELSPGTVRSYLHEARQQLRDALAVFHGESR